MDRPEPDAATDPIGWKYRLVRWAIVLFVAGGILLIPVPEGVTPQSWRLLAIFAATITGSIVQPIPGAAIVLLGVTALALFNVLRINDALAVLNANFPDHTTPFPGPRCLLGQKPAPAAPEIRPVPLDGIDTGGVSLGFVDETLVSESTGAYFVELSGSKADFARDAKAAGLKSRSTVFSIRKEAGLVKPKTATTEISVSSQQPSTVQSPSAPIVQASSTAGNGLDEYQPPMTKTKPSKLYADCSECGATHEYESNEKLEACLNCGVAFDE